MRQIKNNELTVRQAKPEDADRIRALAGQLGYTVHTDQVVTAIRETQQDPRQTVVVAEADYSTLVGWAHLFIRTTLLAQPTAEIGALVVEEALRRNGIGRSLVNELERWAASAGCQAIRVRTNTQRVEADRFYRSAGYTLGKTQSVFLKRLTS